MRLNTKTVHVIRRLHNTTTPRSYLRLWSS
nr:MAG TPA: hypothetical protein [Caudoviricetes sp.]DAS36377.1 MAG TPA: hypothetical protein [Caudoviricetes sp.]DAV09184.1 MAG TPA: hypothetical protein [Caudoviricetes sp.]